MSLLEVSGLSKTYTTRFGGAKVEALKSVTFSVESGEYVAVMGESGSGKTTLLNLLAALDRPTGGTVLLGGQNLAEIPEERAAAFRRDHLGFAASGTRRDFISPRLLPCRTRGRRMLSSREKVSRRLKS